MVAPSQADLEKAGLMMNGVVSTRRALLLLASLYCALLIYALRTIRHGDLRSISSATGSVVIVTFVVLYSAVFAQAGIRFDDVVIRRLMPTFFLQRDVVVSGIRYVWIGLITVALLVIVFFVFPPLVPFIAESFVSPPLKSFVAANKGELKAWLDFWIITLEVAIAVCIGGAAFSEGLANRIRDRLRSWQTTYSQKGEETAKEGVSKAVETASDVKRIYADVQKFDFETRTFWDTVEFYLQKMHEANRVVDNLRELLLKDYPTVIGKLVTANLVSNFPGGIYGMIAFSLFCCLMAAKVAYVYINDVLTVGVVT